jgi:hypothetical protein
MQRLCSTTSSFFAAAAALAMLLACASTVGPVFGAEPLNTTGCGSCNLEGSCVNHCNQTVCCTTNDNEENECVNCYCGSCNTNYAPDCGCD